MNRINKRRIDNTRKARLIPVYESMSSDKRYKINDIIKQYNESEALPSRMITFKTDKKDVWSGYFDSIKIENEY